MLTYDLEGRGSLARYDYLYRCVKEDILSGRLRAGERLPSKRALAAHLNTAVVTVENAYAQLEAEGYLRARERRGYFVCPVESAPTPPPPPEPPEEPGQPEWLLDLGGPGGGTEGFPFSVWARLTRQVLTDEGERLLQAVPHSGVAELRRAISRHLYQVRGIRAAPERIVVGAGTEYLYNQLVQLLGREKIYGLEDPGYSKAAQVYALNGAQCRFLPVDGQGVSLQALEDSGCQVLHISPNHQFPTGVVTPIARRQGMLRWAGQGEGRYIIEDDYDSEFRFTGRPIPTLQSIDTAGRAIYINTFSRTLAPSLRIGYMVLPGSLLEIYRQKYAAFSSAVSGLEQKVLVEFLRSGQFQTHLNRMRNLYRQRREVLAAALGRYDAQLEVGGEVAGHHLLVRDRRGRPEAELCQRALDAGVRVYPIARYFAGPMPPRYQSTVLLGYGALPAEKIRIGVEKLALAWELET